MNNPAANPVNPAANPANPPNPAQPQVKYAVIGYGACGGQFVGDLILERLILHWTNKKASRGSGDVDYHLDITIFSSQGEAESGGGEAWSSVQDGCINSPIPGHPDIPDKGNLPQTQHYHRLAALVTELATETRKDVWHEFDIYMKLFADKNKTAAALIWGRSQVPEFDISRACVPRSILGTVRKKGLDGIIRFVESYFPSITVTRRYDTRAVLHSIQNPEEPEVAYGPWVDDQPLDPNHTLIETFNKVIDCSGARITSVVPAGIRHLGLSHSNPINRAAFDRYLRDRTNGIPGPVTIGIVGAQLNFIDCVAIAATLREFFDFNQDQQPFCSPKTNIPADRFIIFTRGEGGSVKPRLSFTKDWPHPFPYLSTEQLLALRTQKQFDWVSVVQSIWVSMVSYVMHIHPSKSLLNHPTRVHDQWVLYQAECEMFRANENTPTFCGLERTLVDALFNGYGAEASVEEAEQRMMRDFSAIFVSGGRMKNNFYSHLSSIAFLDGYKQSNRDIHRILREWYRTFSSSPVEICEPIYELHRRQAMEHRVGDIEQATVNQAGTRTNIGGMELDLLIAPGQFGRGLDDVVASILPDLETQAAGIPTWRALGQLVKNDGKLVNVWDYGNNRGVGLAYNHFNDAGLPLHSEVMSRGAVNSLAATHEFAPSLAACLLAHDLYSIGRGHNAQRSASDRLQHDIEDQQPDFIDYNRQIGGLEDHYVEIMRRFYFLQAIGTDGLVAEAQWRTYYERGLTREGRREVINELDAGSPAMKQVAQKYDTNTAAIRRNYMDYKEWHAPFNDVEISKAWEILRKANSWYLKHGNPVA